MGTELGSKHWYTLPFSLALFTISHEFVEAGVPFYLREIVVTEDHQLVIKGVSEGFVGIPFERTYPINSLESFPEVHHKWSPSSSAAFFELSRWFVANKLAFTVQKVTTYPVWREGSLRVRAVRFYGGYNRKGKTKQFNVRIEVFSPEESRVWQASQSNSVFPNLKYPGTR